MTSLVDDQKKIEVYSNEASDIRSFASIVDDLSESK